MSKIFYDHLISLEDLESKIKEIATAPEEKEELWNLIDEIIHHRVLGCILDKLPQKHHHTFLCKFHECPYDDSIFQFIDELVEESLEELIVGEIKKVEEELLGEMLEEIPIEK